jgi:hypothetical protein
MGSNYNTYNVMNNIDYVNLYNKLVMSKIYKKMQVESGIITRNNGDSRYAVKISGSSQSMPNVKTVEPNMKFKVGDDVLVQFPFGNIQEARIIGYSDLSIGTEFLYEFEDNGGCCCCFIAGTKVNTVRGNVSIEYLKKNDYIVGYNTSMSKSTIVINKIIKLLKHDKPEELVNSYYKISTNNSYVNTTPNHLFYIGDNKYEQIENINIGNYLYFNYTGNTNIKEKILKKELIIVKKPIITYNLELTGSNNYYANGYLVHNYKYS